MGTVKGLIEVSVNEAKTLASLIFTPQSTGQAWDLKHVLALLEKENVIYGIDRDEIHAALVHFEDAIEKTRSAPVAKGIEASAPEPGDLKLIEKELEFSLKNTMNLVIRKAGPPGFPEMINQDITAATYTLKDEIFGYLSEGKPGEEGNSVYGEKIPVLSAPGGGGFLIGKGIKKSPAGEMAAERTGFIRRGENWVELIPFENHKWKVKSTMDESVLVLEFLPGMRSLKAPEGEKILEEAKELSSEGKLISKEEIDNFVAQTINSRKPAKLTLTKPEESRILLETDPRKLKAELLLVKGRGSQSGLSLKAVSKLLNESGLKKINPEKTKKEILDFYHSTQRETRILLCEGIPPGRGKDRGVNFSVPFLDKSYLDLLVDKVDLDNSLVSHYSSIKSFPIEKIQKLAMVKKDQIIFSLSGDAKGKEGIDVFGEPVPGIKGNDPSLKLFENIDFQKGSAKAAISGILEICEDGESHTLYARIREHANAPIRVNISTNKMTATLSIGLARGTGFAADKQMIRDAMEKAGVKDGFIEENIDEASDKSGLGEVLADMIVAEGKFPLNGNRELKLLHDIDYRDKNKNFVPMKGGEKIGYLLVSGENSEGYTVTGELLVLELDEENIEIGANINQNETDEHDQIELIAAKSGRLIFTGSKLFIQDTILIEGDLSPHMGRIDFPGNVMVNGTVLSKAVVHAGENITIAGVVQAALVSAGGLVKVDKGIKGSQKAVLRGKSVEFEYAEEANIMALEKISCHKTMMRCQIRCNGRMDAIEKGSRIIGGEIRVRDGLNVDTLGNERGIQTAIHFGQDFLIEDQIAQLMKDLDKIQMQILRIDEIIEKARGRADKQDIMTRARDKKVRILKVMEKKNVKLFLLREKFEEHYDSSIIVRGDLYEGTTFYSHGRSLAINTKKRSVEVYFCRDSGKICEKPLN